MEPVRNEIVQETNEMQMGTQTFHAGMLNVLCVLCAVKRRQNRLMTALSVFRTTKIAFGLISAHWRLFNCTKCNKLWFGHKNIHFSCMEYSYD